MPAQVIYGVMFSEMMILSPGVGFSGQKGESALYSALFSFQREQFISAEG